MADVVWEQAWAAAAGFGCGLLHVLWLHQAVHRLGRRRRSPLWLTATLPARVALPAVGVLTLPRTDWVGIMLYLCAFVAARHVGLHATRRLQAN